MVYNAVYIKSTMSGTETIFLADNAEEAEHIYSILYSHFYEYEGDSDDDAAFNDLIDNYKMIWNSEVDDYKIAWTTDLSEFNNQLVDFSNNTVYDFVVTEQIVDRL